MSRPSIFLRLAPTTARYLSAGPPRIVPRSTTSSRYPIRLSPTTRRPFFSLPDLPSPPQTLTASRTLPYPAPKLYTLIADVDAYSSFVPYCSHSRVTHWSTQKPTPTSTTNSDSDSDSPPRLPTQADLRVGWGGFEETFTSRLRCVPNQSVEALSGADIGAAAGGGGSGDNNNAADASGAIFRSLVTRWTVRPSTAGSLSSTVVELEIKFQFANPLYAAVSAAVSDRVAGVMIEAFEQRARKLLGPPSS